MLIKLFISTLIIPIFCFGQGKYIDINYFPDYRCIEKIRNENSRSGYKFLVYQPSSDNAKISSVLIIKNNEFPNYWIIRNDTIIKSGTLKNDDIFTFKDYLKTGATKKEDKLSFVPPLMNGIETVNVIYGDDKVKFYFEFGSNITGYFPDRKLERYRAKWVSIIRDNLIINHILETETE